MENASLEFDFSLLYGFIWVIREFSILSPSDFSNKVYLPISIWICGTVFWVCFCPWFEMAKWAITGIFFFLLENHGTWCLGFDWVSSDEGCSLRVGTLLYFLFTLHHYFCNLSLSLFPLVHAYSLFDKSPKLCPFFIYLFHLVLFILFYFNPRAISIFHKTALVKLTPSSLIWLLF